jgi:aminoglycoside phosphotransferase (APT) family kinase protein
MIDRVTKFFSRHASVPEQELDVSISPITGGLMSSVVRATIRHSRASGPPALTHVVVKQLCRSQRREAAVYRELWSGRDAPPAVRVLGAEKCGSSEFLYLENVSSDSSWPWADTARSAAVCRTLAGLHDRRRIPATSLLDWDYEDELAQSAEETLALAASSGRRCWARLGDLRRVVTALPQIRSRILNAGTTVIHGDVHPGNVMVRKQEDRPVVLIDWARARLGSPFEDVASWLHSLGCWEPEARRRHDTLLRAYLEAREHPEPITEELRKTVWYASASNGLSGAVRYHLTVLTDPTSSEQLRRHAERALAEWQRVIRRVAAVLSTTTAR